jgi:rubredoxin
MSSEEAVESQQLDRYECRACGYVYEPEKGDSRKASAGTPFDELPISWRCPVCGAKPSAFQNIGPKEGASGFKENYTYGLGVNTLTAGQKSLLIFSALGLAVLFFLSLYGLK